MTDKLMPITFTIGQLVLTPTGRTARVKSVDRQRGEASVVGEPWAASFRLANLRPLQATDGEDGDAQLF